jgi:hypothetical protein
MIRWRDNYIAAIGFDVYAGVAGEGARFDF